MHNDKWPLTLDLSAGEQQDVRDPCDTESGWGSCAPRATCCLLFGDAQPVLPALTTLQKKLSRKTALFLRTALHF